MEQIEYQAIEILKSGEPLPVDLYMELNNSGIDPEFLINTFTQEEIEEEYEEEERKERKEIMGFKHREHPIWGLQFHPESFATINGIKILENFLKL